ncbi:PASTA domain-containing protein [Arthrobacter psychrolactophilus]
MKKFIQLSLAALLIAGLSACGSTAPATSSSDTASVSAAATQEKRAVPDVVGMSYKEAYETLVKDDFFAQLKDENGENWTEGSPWADVTIATMDPAAGTMTDESYVDLTLTVTQDEYAKSTKAAE